MLLLPLCFWRVLELLFRCSAQMNLTLHWTPDNSWHSRFTCSIPLITWTTVIWQNVESLWRVMSAQLLICFYSFRLISNFCVLCFISGFFCKCWAFCCIIMLMSEMTHYVLSKTFNPTHSLLICICQVTVCCNMQLHVLRPPIPKVHCADTCHSADVLS